MVRTTSAATKSLAATGAACSGFGTAWLVSEGAKTSALLRVAKALHEGGLVPRSMFLPLGPAGSHALIVLGKFPCNDALHPAFPVRHF
jgi:hypothetical protein